MLFVLPIVNPYGISRTQQNGIPSGCAIGKIENTRKQHPIGMHRNLRNLNFRMVELLREIPISDQLFYWGRGGA